MEYTNYLEKLKGFSPKTIEIYNYWAKELESCDLDYKVLISKLPEYSANTLRLIMSSLISYYKFLKDNRYKDLCLPKREIKIKEYISFKEYKKYLEEININTKMGFMKRICVRLLFETGIRSNELLSIRKEDIRGNKITIHGKGKKQRIVKISNWLSDELERYAQNKTSKIFGFQYKNLYSKIQSLDKERRITPHMFRRGFAKYCHEKGIPILDISLVLGHESIETTAQYIKKNSDDVTIHEIF